MVRTGVTLDKNFGDSLPVGRESARAEEVDRCAHVEKSPLCTMAVLVPTAILSPELQSSPSFLYLLLRYILPENLLSYAFDNGWPDAHGP